METVKLIIDRKPVEVPQGTTILDAAKGMGIRIPTLCYMKLEDLHYENNPGACRICVVEIEGRRNLAPSCKTECMEGMVVQTHSPRVMNARKTVMELILSNHPAECLTCSSNGHCELQAIAHDLGIREIRYKGEMSIFQIDRSPSIVRNMNKCIMCRRCETMCNNIQTVGALTAVNRGFNAAVSTAFERDIAGSTCSYCGQCVSVCPVNALSGRNTQQPVLDALADPDKIVIAQTAPAVRTALGRDFGYEPGTLVTGKMVSALRRLGFDYVFDTDFAADLTIMEEGTELLQRIGKYLKGDQEVKMPLMTSCCPGWVSFVEQHFPELLDNLSTAKSPQQMFGAIAKSYFAEKLGVDRKRIVVEDHVADAFLVVLLLDVERRVCRGAQLHGALLDLFEFGFREPARVGDCRVNVVTLLLGEVFYTKRGVQTAAERQNHFLLGFHDILFFCFFIHQMRPHTAGSGFSRLMSASASS